MSTAVEIVLALVVVFVLLALFYGGAAVVQLARLQAAVMKHRASAGSWDDDDALYLATGFDPVVRLPRPPIERPRDTTFMRGDQIR